MPYFPASIFIFLTGLIIGSFLNCLIYRLALPNFSWKNLRGLRGRSYCPHCKHTLSWQDLIPVLSFFILRGKCRYCRQKISFQYPLVELATAAIFLLIFNKFGVYNFQSFFALCLMLGVACLMIVVFVFDLKHYLIPDEITLSAVFLALIYQLLKINDSGLQIADFKQLLNPLLAAFGASAFFLALVLISRGKWMGLGDVKFAVFMGLFLGWPNILAALFLAFFIGAIIGVGLIIFNKKGWKSEIPFGPFLVIATFLAMFFGQNIAAWYLGLYLI